MRSASKRPAPAKFCWHAPENTYTLLVVAKDLLSQSVKSHPPGIIYVGNNVVGICRLVGHGGESRGGGEGMNWGAVATTAGVNGVVGQIGGNSSAVIRVVTTKTEDSIIVGTELVSIGVAVMNRSNHPTSG